MAAAVSGSLLIMGGAAAHLLGLYGLLVASTEKCEQEPCNTGVPKATGLTVAGLGAIGVGIALFVWGAREVPVRTGSVPAWVGAPGGAGWQWRF